MNKAFKLGKFDEFLESSVRASLKKISVDESKNPNVYLSECKTKVIDFDEVKKVYLKNRGMLEGDSMSVDALYMLPSGLLCMVEFKNGDFSSADIIEKAMSSVLIFNDITEKNIKFTRDNMIFVLVYNSEVKRPNPRQKAACGKAKLAKRKYSIFGLEHLNGFCFNDVVEIEKTEFDNSEYVKDIRVF